MKTEGRARLSDSGRVVTPTNVRRAIELHTGDQLLFQITEEGLLLTTLKQRVENAQRRVRKKSRRGVSLVDELIAERRAEARKELK
jgi:bifunctional DNA-binding transcriptional regulator/antitoxin component of YhaV-PrlF toxin-antitoxin module